MVSWEPWDSGSIPSLAQWLKDLVLPQLQLRLQLWLEFDPCPGNPRVAKKKKKKSWETVFLVLWEGAWSWDGEACVDLEA